MSTPVWVNMWIIKDQDGRICYQGLDFSSYERAKEFLERQLQGVTLLKLTDFSIVQKDVT